MIILYSNDCPRCKTLKTLLDREKIEYQVSNDMDYLIGKGFSTTPMLEVDDNYLDFNDALKWIKNLERK